MSKRELVLEVLEDIYPQLLERHQDVYTAGEVAELLAEQLVEVELTRSKLSQYSSPMDYRHLVAMHFDSDDPGLAELLYKSYNA